jgi:hypothetical protein
MISMIEQPLVFTMIFVVHNCNLEYLKVNRKRTAHEVYNIDPDKDIGLNGIGAKGKTRPSPIVRTYLIITQAPKHFISPAELTQYPNI